MPELVERYQSVWEQVRRTAEAAGRDPDSVKLLAVSKFFPKEDIEELYRHGVRMFGESRIPELQGKAAALPPDIDWHFIGQLQANKVRKAVGMARMIHSIDHSELLERLDRIAGEEGKKTAFLLEINISGEESKSGCRPEALPELARVAAACKNAVWQGLMTMAPESAEQPVLAHVFGTLKRMRDDLQQQYGRELPELSMGMSGDWPEAVRQGATVVRIGSAIFGHRNYSA